ncbi:MAG: hypothetical protein R3D57_00880 [Hyphomicrobiaceae bacterium]
MEPSSGHRATDRHALVMAIWLTGGFLAVVLVHLALSTGQSVALYAAGGTVLAAFVGHIVTNAVYRTAFTRRELTLALVLYAMALVAFALATLLEPGFKEAYFLPLGLVLVGVGAAVLFYMITHYGMRDVFESFNVVRDANVRERSDLVQKRWRSRQ